MAIDLGCLTTKTKCHFLTALNVDITIYTMADMMHFKPSFKYYRSQTHNYPSDQVKINTK